MKGRHQFRRRFSLQPSFFKADSEDERTNDERHPQQNRIDHQHSKSSDVSSSTIRHSSAMTRKIVVLGGAKVGKTSLIDRFLYGKFEEKYKKTIEEMHRKVFRAKVDASDVADSSGVASDDGSSTDSDFFPLTLEILDTSGSFEFPAMRDLSIHSGDAFLLVYDVGRSATFDQVRILRDLIHETKKNEDVPIVVVGNKTDLVGNREIDTATTESVVTVDWENGFVECSAKENRNVAAVFRELLVQAKLKCNFSLSAEFGSGGDSRRRRRRQSLPPASASPDAGRSVVTHQQIPTPTQIRHLQQIRDRHEKRNSCVVS